MLDSYISVSQLNNYIRDIFNSEVLLQNICVFGEISSYNISNGIAYFNLKDENGMLQCVLFGANNFQKPNIGDLVLVKGGMNYYVKGGKLSFNAISIEPYGRGQLYEKFLKLKEDLESRGYFAESRKKKLPERVRRIGVVTSSTGAVIRDIIDVTTRRNDTIDIVLYPVKVQGIGAEHEISSGIRFFSDYEDIDVIIVARGGGSMEDLEPFNSEIVANAVYDCKKPLVSAVGHETDFTIIDFVADMRAPTPSAAAEIVAWDKSLEIGRINGYVYNFEKIISNKLKLLIKDIDFCYQKIDNLSVNKLHECYRSIDGKISKIFNFDKKIDNALNTIEKNEIKISGLNPKNLSSMGYSKVIKNSKVVSLSKKIKKDDKLILSMIDGDVNCIVE
ncbi:MAG: exodeoxyribonuclease VII large subunit [Clostridiales bacterium]|nr:exodeoxyribonuclease VII large subunit [Clostridiales bacterium]